MNNMTDEQISNKQIKVGAIISYTGIVLGILATLLYTPWMVSKIGKSNYAIYTLANSFIGIFLMDFGLGSAVTKFVSQYRAENNKEKIQWFMSCIFKLYIIIDIIIFLVLSVLFFCIDSFYKGLTAEEIAIYRSIYVMIAIYSVASFPFVPITGILDAYEKFIQVQILNVIQKILTVILGIIALSISSDVRVIVLSNIIVGVGVILCKTILAWKYARIKLSAIKLRWDGLKGILGFSIWATVLNIGERFTFSIAPSVLGTVSNSEEIALFAPASALESYFFTVAAAINGFFLPRISRYVAEGKKEHLTALMVRVGRYQILLLGLIFSCFCVVGKDFLSLWMGADFVKAAYCAMLLFLPDIFRLSQLICYSTVLAENKLRQYSYGHILMAITSTVVMPILGKKMGAIGVSAAIVLAFTVQFLWDNYVYDRYLSVNIRVFYVECYLKLLLPVLVFTVFAAGISTFIYTERMLTGFIIKAVVVSGLYFILAFLLLNKEEREAAASLLGKRRKGL